MVSTIVECAYLDTSQIFLLRSVMGNVSGAEFYEKAVINQDEKAVKEILTSDPSLASWVDSEGYSVLQRLCA